MPPTREPADKTATYHPRTRGWCRLPFVCHVSLVLCLLDRSCLFVSICCLALCFCFGLGCSLIIAEREDVDVFADHEFSLSILFTVKPAGVGYDSPLYHPWEAGNSKILVNCVLFWLVLQYMTASTLDYHHVHLLHPRRSFLSLEFLHPFSLEL